MTRRSARAAFNADAIGGAIDDILPKRTPAPRASNATPDANATPEASVAASVDTAAPATVPVPTRDSEATEKVEARSTPGVKEKRRPGPKRSVGTAPIVDVDAAVGRKVRRAHSKDSRSYSAMVLEAIQKNAEALATAWAVPEPGEPDPSQLFPGFDAGTQIKRRREEVVRLTLSGMQEAHLATLDALERKWNAPSRVALIEEALRLEYVVKPGGTAKPV